MDDAFSIPSVDTIDIEILMHRDAHFAGNFGVMLEYYEEDGVGVMPDFSIERIKNLLKIEETLGSNLSEELLPDSAKESVRKSKHLYLELRSVYEDKKTSDFSVALSDLILTEKDYPKEEITTLINFKKLAVKPLIDLIQTDTFYDPLFPGYGRAPLFAAEVLGETRDEKAIPALFEALSQDNFFTDEAMILALAKFQKKSEDFLLKRLCSKPISKDNERAIMALNSFQESESLSKACLHLLEDKDFLVHPHLVSYLILGCSHLKDEEDIKLFQQLKSVLPKVAYQEFDLIARSF